MIAAGSTTANSCPAGRPRSGIIASRRCTDPDAVSERTRTMTIISESPPATVQAYVGTGSQRTPFDVLMKMPRLARWLQRRGFHLRTRLDNDAERAFMRGVSWLSSAEIYADEPLPEADVARSCYRTLAPEEMNAARDLIASLDHDGQNSGIATIGPAAAYALLGRNLRKPVDFVIYWAAEDESLDGILGRMAGSICKRYRIRCWNLRMNDDVDRMRAALAAIDAASKEIL
jgi:hypothetical protein